MMKGGFIFEIQHKSVHFVVSPCHIIETLRKFVVLSFCVNNLLFWNHCLLSSLQRNDGKYPPNSFSYFHFPILNTFRFLLLSYKKINLFIVNLLHFFRIVVPWFFWIQDYLFNLKFTAKQLVRQAKKAEKAEKQEKLKLKKVSSSSLAEIRNFFIDIDSSILTTDLRLLFFYISGHWTRKYGRSSYLCTKCNPTKESSPQLSEVQPWLRSIFILFVFSFIFLNVFVKEKLSFLLSTEQILWVRKWNFFVAFSSCLFVPRRT